MEKLSKVREIMMSRVDVDMGLRKTFSQCYHQNDEQCGYSETEGSDWKMLCYWNSVVSSVGVLKMPFICILLGLEGEEHV